MGGIMMESVLKKSPIQWTEEDRIQLYFIIESEWGRLNIYAWEAWLKSLGIEWAELDDEVKDAPPGTIAVWEGPGFENKNRKQCWVVPNDMALKLIALDPSPRRVTRD
jgi:hypothetical protein